MSIMTTLAESASQMDQHAPKERSLHRNLGLMRIPNREDARADTSPEFVFSFQDVKQLG